MKTFFLLMLLFGSLFGCTIGKPMTQPFCTEFSTMTPGGAPCVGWYDRGSNRLSTTWTSGFDEQALIFVDVHGDLRWFRFGEFGERP